MFMDDEVFMRVAIDEAKRAAHPFGAAVVINGEVISSAGSGEEFDPTAHAEIKAIRLACKKLQENKLSEAVLYTTCEPCPMCFAAAWWADIKQIVYGISLEESHELYGKEILINAERMNQAGEKLIKLRGGLLKEEILKLFPDKN